MGVKTLAMEMSQVHTCRRIADAATWFSDRQGVAATRRDVLLTLVTNGAASLLRS